ncbi:hypothetical protein CR194_13000 [Salipaludibacillus keqinensis]|uniref:Polysaccharide polymerase n=1 Tax=Salipaludibacillus keqinensis TaxID=2045207 RepID=A0A323TAM6_9BACI|nr:hypothetical protein [Salipaludibacillus keqinensis]PYZ92582.1 hypothetical protein CR194_13000 [Salipaludibacillus keqinensis]
MSINLSKIISILISLYFILAPFYFFSSGLPQIADYIIAVVIIVYIIYFNFEKDIRFYLSIIILTLITVINAIWSMILTSPNMNVNTIYFIFNIVILLIIINLNRIDTENLLKHIKLGVIISLVIQFLIAITGEFTSGRTVLYFNNPNQLGYYSLLQLCFINLLYFINRISFKSFLVFSFISIYLVLISLSSAAIIAGIVLFTLGMLNFFILKFNTRQKSIISTILILLIMVQLHAHITETDYSINIIEDVQTRLESKTYDTESNFSERRYNRIFEHPEYLLTGAGQGGLDRFPEGGEIHASIPAFFFTYGIIGLILVVLLFYNLLGKITFLTVLILFAVHFYGLTHQGLRQPMFWILIALIYVTNKYKLKKVFGGSRVLNTNGSYR